MRALCALDSSHMNCLPMHYGATEFVSVCRAASGANALMLDQAELQYPRR